MLAIVSLKCLRAQELFLPCNFGRRKRGRARVNFNPIGDDDLKGSKREGGMRRAKRVEEGKERRRNEEGKERGRNEEG